MPGVDIDFVRVGGGGGNPHEANDGTDVNGNFTTTVDPGVWEVRFFPPPPPTTTLLTAVRTPVVITGTVNMGTITLTKGVSLQGTFKNVSNVPVAGVKVDVLRTATNEVVLMKNNVSDAFGTFNVAVPKTTLTAQIRTNAVVGQTLAPKELTATILVNTNLGNITLLNGFHLTGTVHRTSGTAVSGANIDVEDDATGVKLFTPGDNTTVTGTFDVVVPAGTFNVLAFPPTGQVLVAAEVKHLAVSAAVNVGIMTMQNGVFVSGTVLNADGSPALAADVNVFKNGLKVPMDNDNTNAAGAYQVIAPTGTLTVVFSPSGHPGFFRKDIHWRIPVASNTVVNGQFAGDPPVTNGTRPGPVASSTRDLLRGFGIPGSNGSVPSLGATLDSELGLATLQVTGGAPGASGKILFGLGQGPLAGHLGVRGVSPVIEIPVILDTNGQATLKLPIEAITRAGRTTYAQLLLDDRDAATGHALSSALVL